MNISADSLRLDFLQSAQARSTGNGLSSDASAGADRSQSPGRTVADQIIGRLGAGSDETGRAGDASGLRDALASALDWVRGRYGDDAGAAASGMLLSATADGVDEESLGDGLLDTLRFIDRNFGVTAGNTAIAEFNAGVNRELNDYFDNGADEIFHVVDSGAQAETAGDVNARFLVRAVEASDADGADAATMAEQLLAPLQNDLDRSAALTDLASQLDERFAPGAALENALAAYGDAFPETGPQFADLAV